MLPRCCLAIAISTFFCGFQLKVHAQSVPPSSPLSIDLATIGKICTGQTPLTMPGSASGQFTSENGYTFTFDAKRDLEISQSGTIMYRIEKPTLDDVAKCVSQIAVALSQRPLSEQRSCRIPSNGIESYRREFEVRRTSPEMSGGHSQLEWCSDLTATLRGEQPGAAFTVVGRSESSRSGCAPFNCPLYTYSCTLHVKADPIYLEKKSPDCP